MSRGVLGLRMISERAYLLVLLECNRTWVCRWFLRVQTVGVEYCHSTQEAYIEGVAEALLEYDASELSRYKATLVVVVSERRVGECPQI